MIPSPKKITPAKIRESIVQVFFSTGIPFEPLVGYVFSILNQAPFGLNYLNQPLPPPRPQALEEGPVENIELAVGPRHFFYNDDIKINLQNGSLIFNCVDEYIGWEKYSAYIWKILEGLSKANIFTMYHRVGIRYISEFSNIDILEKVDFSVRSSVLDGDLMNGTFRVQWQKDEYRISLVIGTKLSSPPYMAHPEVEKVDCISLIDVDVIQEKFEEPNVYAFLDMIEKVHIKEKEIFFTLLRKEFLDTLQPEYG